MKKEKNCLENEQVVRDIKEWAATSSSEKNAEDRRRVVNAFLKETEAASIDLDAKILNFNNLFVSLSSSDYSELQKKAMEYSRKITNFLLSGYCTLLANEEKERLTHQRERFKELAQVAKDKEQAPIVEPASSKRHSVLSIALAYRFMSETQEGDSITSSNCDTIAGEYGYTAKTSGHRLKQDFDEKTWPKDRIAINNSKRTATNKIKHITEAIRILQTKKAPLAAKKAMDELMLLQKKSESL